MSSPHGTSNTPNKPLVFISYARADHADEGRAPDCFVQKLYRALEDEGFTPWLDHHDLPSRGTPFPKELALAVQSAERFIAVCAPHYPASDWCRAERDHAHLYCISITPVLVEGDFKDCVPADVDIHNAIDMRAGFEATWPALLKRLKQESARPGKLAFTPGDMPEQRPTDLPRPALFDQVKQSLRADQTDPITITGTRALTTMFAAGGIGKSTLAAQIARDCELRVGFPDGVAWIRLGEQQTDPETLRILVGAAFGIPADSLRGPGGQFTFVQEMQDRDALIVLDDVWSLAQVNACRVQGPNLRYLITTRRSDLGESLKLPHENRIRMDYLAVEEGMALIARRLGLDPAADYPHKDIHRQIVETLGHHTQALDLAAAHLRPRDEGGSGPDYAPTLLQQLQKGDNALFELLKRSVDDDSREGNLLKSLSVSYAMLPDTLQRCFRLLGVLAPGGSFDAAMAAAVWAMDDPESARRLLNELTARSLLIPAQDSDRWTLHALIHAAARVLLRQAGEVDTAFDRYADHVISIAEQFRELPLEEWHTLTPDLPHIHVVGDALVEHWQAAQDAPDEALTARALQFAVNVKNYVFNRPQMVDTPQGRERLGLRWLEMGLDISRQADDQDREALFCNDIGLAWDALGEKRKALEYYEQALPLRRAVGDRAGEAVTCFNMGMIYRSLGDFDKAIEYVERCVELDIQVEHPDLESDRAALEQLKRERDGGGDSQEEQAAQAMRMLAQLYAQGGADAVREALRGQAPDEVIEMLIAQLAQGGENAPAPGGLSTLPAETVDTLAGNTVAVKTQVPDKLDEWRQNLQGIRTDFAGRNWANEIAFVDALLAVLDDQPAALPDNNPYAPVVRLVVEAIRNYPGA